MKLLSRYLPSYPRSLAYMFQASEYYVGDYLEWYLRTTDFSRVEKVGRLKYTKKALVILAAIWLEHLLLIGLIFWFTVSNIASYAYWPLLLQLLVPFFLPYLAILPVVFIKYFLQLPYEIMIAGKIKRRIAGHKATKIAIAGSYGKTTMREILRTILGSSLKVASPGGSINTLLGIKGFIETLTGEEDVVIFELGEYYPGDIAKLCRVVVPDIGIITGINEAHLKRFGTIDKTIATIYELADSLGEKPLYINEENILAKRAAKGKYTFFSHNGCGDVVVKEAKSGLDGTEIQISHNKHNYDLRTDILGKHLVGSIAAAINIALGFKMGWDDIVRGVAATKPFARRLELVSSKDGIYILDDSYNGNPDGVKAVLDFLGSLGKHRKLYLTSGLVEMGDKQNDVHREIARQLISASIDKVLLVRTSMTEIIANALEAEGYKGEVIWFDSTISAHKSLPHLTVKGDVVLLQTDLPDQYK